ncbi:uncharacterized protein LOC106074456 [Biomphalaria glabrata]|uniref:Uncharacterized protein LOC106074456 n=1 Tax=Biomphalaria glabrata TaxID=6526 RepID=A0A9W3ASI4_BIOGL|nr:uncharacterized protein LOC106074456 [Biomphalaria glabrata]
MSPWLPLSWMTIVMQYLLVAGQQISIIAHLKYQQIDTDIEIDPCHTFLVDRVRFIASPTCKLTLKVPVTEPGVDKEILDIVNSIQKGCNHKQMCHLKDAWSFNPCIKCLDGSIWVIERFEIIVLLNKNTSLCSNRSVEHMTDVVKEGRFQPALLSLIFVLSNLFFIIVILAVVSMKRISNPRIHVYDQTNTDQSEIHIYQETSLPKSIEYDEITTEWTNSEYIIPI